MLETHAYCRADFLALASAQALEDGVGGLSQGSNIELRERAANCPTDARRTRDTPGVEFSGDSLKAGESAIDQASWWPVRIWARSRIRSM